MLRDVSVEEVVEFAVACERQLLALSGGPGMSALAPRRRQGSRCFMSKHLSFDDAVYVLEDVFP